MVNKPVLAPVQFERYQFDHLNYLLIEKRIPYYVFVVQAVVKKHVSFASVEHFHQLREDEHSLRIAPLEQVLALRTESVLTRLLSPICKSRFTAIR